MSVYGMIWSLQHPDEFDGALAASDGRVIVVRAEETASEERALGSPWVYRGSHVIPEAGDERRGGVDLGAIPAVVEDARRGVPEEDHREGDLPWLRLSVRTGTLRGEGDEATVVLDKAQAAELRDAINGWLGGGGGGMSAREAAGVDLSERVADLVEPRPPKPEGERWAELQEKFFAATFGVGKIPLSEGGAWSAICVYDEGDEPEWQARNFSGDFDLAMFAFRLLAPAGALALHYEPGSGWQARLDGADSGEEEGTGGSAAEAVCRLLLSRHRRGPIPQGAKA